MAKSSSKFHVVITVFQRGDRHHSQAHTELREFDTDEELAGFLNTVPDMNLRFKRMESFLSRLGNDLASRKDGLVPVGKYIQAEFMRPKPFDESPMEGKLAKVLEEGKVVIKPGTVVETPRGDRFTIGGKAPALPSTADRIRNYLAGHPYCTVKMINRALDISSASSYVSYMMKKGAVLRRGLPNRQGGVYVYMLVTKGWNWGPKKKSRPGRRVRDMSNEGDEGGKFSTGNLKALVSESPGLTATEISKVFKLPTCKMGQVTGLLKMLTDRGVLRRKGKPFRYYRKRLVRTTHK